MTSTNLEKSPILEETVQSGIFHIHIDSRINLGDKNTLFDYFKQELGFYDTNFSGHPIGYASITTPHPHLTLKLRNKPEFEERWEKVSRACRDSDFAGYIEGEVIPIDELVQSTKYNEKIPIPFTLQKRSLRGPPQEEFREIELHLTMDAEKSHPEVIHHLLDAGFSGAYMPKKRGDIEYKAIILTAQGFRKTIHPLTGLLRDYLSAVGGVQRGTIKVEKVLKYELFHMDYAQLPLVVEEICLL